MLFVGFIAPSAVGQQHETRSLCAMNDEKFNFYFETPKRNARQIERVVFTWKLLISFLIIPRTDVRPFSSTVEKEK